MELNVPMHKAFGHTRKHTVKDKAVSSGQEIAGLAASPHARPRLCEISTVSSCTSGDDKAPCPVSTHVHTHTHTVSQPEQPGPDPCSELGELQ